MFQPQMIHDVTPDNIRMVADQYTRLPTGANFITEIAFWRAGADALENVEKVRKLMEKRGIIDDDDLLDLIDTIIN